MECRKCGAHMVLRNGKYGQFWGCSNYKNGCKNIVQYKKKEDINIISSNEFQAGFMNHKIDEVINSELTTDQQRSFFNDVLSKSKHIFMPAGAGCGKSFSAMIGMFVYKNEYVDAKTGYTCFNKSVQKDFLPKSKYKLDDGSDNMYEGDDFDEAYEVFKDEMEKYM